MSDTGTWTAAELHEAKLRFAVGYYGGHLFGITWSVSYTVPKTYIYEYTVSADETFVVVIGSSSQTTTMYMKINGSWTPIAAAYKKVNGSWTQISDLTAVFESGVNYKMN